MVYNQNIMLSLENFKMCRAIRNIQKTVTIKKTILKLELGMITEKILDLMMTPYLALNADNKRVLLQIFMNLIKKGCVIKNY